MFNLNDKDKQAEFFSNFSGASGKPKKAKFRLGKVTLSLSYENIFLLSIGLIMLLIVCYSLGVEKGRYLVQVKDEVLDVKQEQVKEKAKEALPKPPEKKAIRVKVAQSSLAGQSPAIDRRPAYIQVASFRTDKYARKETARLKNKGYRSFITTSGKYKVVCVGRYKDKSEASGDLKKLKKIYGDCYVRLNRY